MKKTLLPCLLAVLLLLPGCMSTLVDTFSSFIPPEYRTGAKGVAEGLDLAITGFAGFTPEQEHYIGRGVAAYIAGSYKPLNNPAANEYLNLLGQSLADCTESQKASAGYRFLLLDSKEVNAFSAPGGFVLVTRGLVRTVENEDELAAALAHEIAHVELEHGVKNIQFQVIIEGAKKAGLTSAKEILPAKKQEILNKVYTDTVNSVAITLLNKGYTNSDENSADEYALVLLEKAGYSKAALPMVLTRLQQRDVGRDGFFTKTHPNPEERAAQLGITESIPKNSARQQRFTMAFKGLGK